MVRNLSRWDPRFTRVQTRGRNTPMKLNAKRRTIRLVISTIWRATRVLDRLRIKACRDSSLLRRWDVAWCFRVLRRFLRLVFDP